MYKLDLWSELTSQNVFAMFASPLSFKLFSVNIGWIAAMQCLTWILISSISLEQLFFFLGGNFSVKFSVTKTLEESSQQLVGAVSDLCRKWKQSEAVPLWVKLLLSNVVANCLGVKKHSTHSRCFLSTQLLKSGILWKVLLCTDCFTT